MLERARLRPAVRERALAIFEALGRAEAAVHGIALARVHFHEVGAVDAIVDVAGAAIGLDRLGVARVTASAVALGDGSVETAHGRLPLPAPATLELLRGIPTVPAHVHWETVTPTGAAILRSVVDEFRSLPALTIEAIGHGAGDDRPGPMPNVLRAVLGRASGASADRVVSLETNLDDLVPEHFDYLMERLFEAGALDVAIQHLQMKKNRPGFGVRVLGRPSDRLALARVLFARVDRARRAGERAGSPGARARAAQGHDGLRPDRREAGARRRGSLRRERRVRRLQARGQADRRRAARRGAGRRGGRTWPPRADARDDAQRAAATRASSEGERSPGSTSRPSTCPGADAAAALCLHGLTGTPYEVRPLAEALSRSGIRAVGPALPGHNQTPAQLARTSHGDWLDAAREHLHSLRARHDRVFVVGVSLGGLLGLALAAEEPIDAAVVVGTPLRFSRALGALDPAARPLRAVREEAWGLGHPGAGRPESSPELRRDAAGQRSRVDPSATPGATAPLARERTHPDRPWRARPHRAPIGCAIHPCRAWAPPSASCSMLEASGHVATVDYDGALLARAAAEFLSRFA